jgi:hypothetical protein
MPGNGSAKTLRERCEEIVRLIDETLNATFPRRTPMPLPVPVDDPDSPRDW